MPAGSFRNYFDDFLHMLGLVPVYLDCWLGCGEKVLRAIERYNVAFVQLFLPLVLEFEKLEEQYDMRSMLSSLKGAAFAGMPLGKVLTEKVRDRVGRRPVHLHECRGHGDRVGGPRARRLLPLGGHRVGRDARHDNRGSRWRSRGGRAGRHRSGQLGGAVHPFPLRRPGADNPRAGCRAGARMPACGYLGRSRRRNDRRRQADVGGGDLAASRVDTRIGRWDLPGGPLLGCDGPPQDSGRVPTDRTGDLDELRVRATGVLEQGLGAGVDMELCPIDDLLATASSVAKFSRVVKA